jgi:hypothetical protein
MLTGFWRDRLNIHHQSNLESGANIAGVPAGSTLRGFCSLPQRGVTNSTPSSAYVIDGCKILSGTLPEGDYGGGTSVHEVGMSTSRAMFGYGFGE